MVVVVQLLFEVSQSCAGCWAVMEIDAAGGCFLCHLMSSMSLRMRSSRLRLRLSVLLLRRPRLSHAIEVAQVAVRHRKTQNLTAENAVSSQTALNARLSAARFGINVMR